MGLANWLYRLKSDIKFVVWPLSKPIMIVENGLGAKDEDNIVVYHQLPYAYVPMHVHKFIELIYVYEGHCTVLLQDGEIEVGKGEIIIIDKQPPHTVKANTKSDAIVDIKIKTWLFFSRFANKSIISQFLVGSLMDKRKANNYLYFLLEDGSKVPDIMNQLMCEYFDRDFCTVEMIN